MKIKHEEIRMFYVTSLQGANCCITHCPTVMMNVTVPLQSCTSHYNAGTWGIVQGQLRPLLAPRVYTLPMVRSIGKTMVQGKNYGPQITVKRISTRSVFMFLLKFLRFTYFCTNL